VGLKSVLPKIENKMKKLLLIALAFMALQATAQERQRMHQNDSKKERAHKFKDLTPEEAATLQTKKMALHLDLTEVQQAKIHALNLENAKMRKAKMEARKAMKEDEDFVKPTKEERLKMKNERLDNQIARKQKMKAILNAEQYEKWSAQSQRRQGKKGSPGKRMKKQ
jgi:hypothetical protein